MTIATLDTPGTPSERPELVPQYFDTDRIVTPEGNPVYTPAMLDDLIESMQVHGQLVPGWVSRSAELPEGKLLCIEGNRRLAVARMLGLPFWAFDHGRDVPEEERIRLTFQHNHKRRVMGYEEIADRAARFMELTGCTAAEAAKHLITSGPTLSRAFGEKRIPAEWKPRAEKLGLSIRSLIAAMPPHLMGKAIEYAETPGPDGRKRTRDQVSLYIRQLKKGGKSNDRGPKVIPLKLGGRVITVAVGEKDSATAVAEDLKAIAAKLNKHSDVPPPGWPFLFQ